MVTYILDITSISIIALIATISIILIISVIVSIAGITIISDIINITCITHITDITLWLLSVNQLIVKYPSPDLSASSFFFAPLRDHFPYRKNRWCAEHSTIGANSYH